MWNRPPVTGTLRPIPTGARNGPLDEPVDRDAKFNAQSNAKVTKLSTVEAFPHLKFDAV